MTTYVKFSNERNPQFRIHTSIVEKDNHHTIIKSPFSNDNSENMEYVKTFINNEKLLRETCEKCQIPMLPAPIKEIPNGEVEIKYIEGKSLFNIIHTYKRNHDYASISTIVEKYKFYITSLLGSAPFKKPLSLLKFSEISPLRNSHPIHSPMWISSFKIS